MIITKDPSGHGLTDSHEPGDMYIMELQKLRDYLETEVSYPIDSAHITETVGTMTIDAPNLDESYTIGKVLGDMEDSTYETPDELFTMILSNLPDEYIGRKYYDDRDKNVDIVADGPQDTINQSI